MFFTLLVSLYGLLMFASSYVEEEHHFWYWTTCFWFFYLFLRSLQQSFGPGISSLQVSWRVLMLLPLHRLVRSWNQTGQKFAGFPDLVTSFLIPHPTVLWWMIGITYLVLSLRLGTHFSKYISSTYHIITRSLAAGVVVPAFLFKLSFTARDSPEMVRAVMGDNGLEVLSNLPLVTMAQVVFIGCVVSCIWIVAIDRVAISLKKPGAGDVLEQLNGLHTVLTIFLVTQTRAHNIPLYLLFHLQLGCLASFKSEDSFRRLTVTEITTTTVLLAHTAFFALGNSNAISGIDLSNAYNGISGYNAAAVGMLVFLSNWAGPIWWAWAGVGLLASCSSFTKGVTSNGTAPKPSTSGSGGLKAPAPASEHGKKTDTSRLWVQDERDRLRALANPNSPHLHNFPKDFPSPMQTAFPESESPFFGYLALQTVFISSSLLAVMVACTALRTHLFIWTVFSPKYLFAMAWSLGWHLVVCCGFCTAVWWGLVS